MKYFVSGSTYYLKLYGVFNAINNYNHLYFKNIMTNTSRGFVLSTLIWKEVLGHEYMRVTILLMNITINLAFYIYD